MPKAAAKSKGTGKVEKRRGKKGMFLSFLSSMGLVRWQGSRASSAWMDPPHLPMGGSRLCSSKLLSNEVFTEITTNDELGRP